MSGMNGAQKLVASAVLGGLGSVAGGGKFANGAITGAFGYLFNNRAGRIAGAIVGGVVGAAATGPENVPLIVEGAAAGAAIGDRLTGPDVPTIGQILSGYGPDTLIHLTPDPAQDFQAGVKPDTFFARLGDVSHMTVAQYQADVVGKLAPAGPGQPVNGFVLANPLSSGVFTQAGIFNNSGTMEYTNTYRFTHDGYKPLR
jgi:hypothetical protein